MAWPIIIAAAGAAVSAFGSMQASNAAQSNANDQAKAAKEQWKWNWKDTKDKESYAQYLVDVARKNNENVAIFTDAVSKAKYDRQLAIRDFDYKNDVEEFNEAEEQYADQIDYNALAATLAKDEQAVWLDEQLDTVDFDRKEQDNWIAEQRATIKFDRKGVANRLVEQQQAIKLDKEGVADELDERLDTIKFDRKGVANKLVAQQQAIKLDKEGVEDKLAEQRDTIKFDKEGVADKLDEQLDTIGFNKEDVQKDTTMKLNEIGDIIPGIEVGKIYMNVADGKMYKLGPNKTFEVVSLTDLQT